MSNWNYISKRRGYTLESFVESATNLQEALEIFRRKGVRPPTDGSLQSLFSESGGGASTLEEGQSEVDVKDVKMQLSSRPSREKGKTLPPKPSPTPDQSAETAPAPKKKKLKKKSTDQTAEVSESEEGAASETAKPKKNKWGIVEKDSAKKK